MNTYFHNADTYGGFILFTKLSKKTKLHHIYPFLKKN